MTISENNSFMPQTLRFSTDSDQPASGQPDSGQPDDAGRREVARDEAAQRDAAQADEANMRRALGMLGGAARQQQPSQARDRRPATPLSSTPRRHRFIQDGDVPVTVMRTRADGAAEPSLAANGSPVNRLETVQTALAAEHTARERAERALEEAQGVIRDLRTKLAHMELAREEAVAQRNLAEAAQIAEAAADAALPTVPAAATVEARVPRASTRAPKRLAVPRPPRPEKEPQPVKWWVKPRAKKAEAKS